MTRTKIQRAVAMLAAHSADFERRIRDEREFLEVPADAVYICRMCAHRQGWLPVWCEGCGSRLIFRERT